tara:strand:- start:864 stop:2027 length:1164 start_codon:yes stop_codon:yes gene_type:complete
MFINAIFSKSLNFINNLFYKYFNYWYNNYNYEKILEYVPDLTLKIKDKKIKYNYKYMPLREVYEDKLVDSISNICNKLNNKKLIISLSGGIDSMVLTTILHYINYEIICVHINYNNRRETRDEEKFLREWCKYNSIKLYVKSINNIKRENTKRSEYELITKNLRLDFYKEIMKKEDIDYILLAHHKDDIIENIVANLCRGRNYLDLSVIRERSYINNIIMIRPMLSFYKTDIYKFAHTYNVPYFKDTTPNWSVRGKYRNIIGPALEDAFSKNIKENLLNISKQADDWNLLIEQEIIRPFLSNIVYEINIEKILVTINIEKYIEYPLTFWYIIFADLFNQHGYSSPSKKSIQVLINSIKEKKNKNFNLCNKCKCAINNYKIVIEFKSI